MSVSIDCKNVEFDIKKRTILHDISLVIPQGCFFGIVGPSGTGKTTLLRLFAGLNKPSRGTIRFFGAEGKELRQSELNVSLLFQSLALWPHATVKEHVDLVSPNTRQERPGEEILLECGITKTLWSRYPHQLSAGELQRVGLARALAAKPMLLLVDEPLVNVDQQLRSQIQSLLKNVHARYETTIVYVTHQWEEIANLCDHVAVLDGGGVIQQGRVDDVYWHPKSRRCADFSGAVVDISVSLINSGKVAVEGEILEKSVRSLGMARPQQIDFITPRNSNSWVVSRAFPSESTWHYEFQSEEDKISLSSSNYFAVGEVVGIAIRKF